MSSAVRLALVGSPNSGKSSLFNALTGARQKIANYAGVTVERKLGDFTTSSGKDYEIVDLPGMYSLKGRSPDEKVASDIVMGKFEGEKQPDFLIAVLDTTHIRKQMRMVLELRDLGVPMMVLLNMYDLAERDGFEIDTDALSKELGVPVVKSVAVRKAGMTSLQEFLDKGVDLDQKPAGKTDGTSGQKSTTAYQSDARTVAKKVILKEGMQGRITRQLDEIFLHPVFGVLILMLIFFGMFQAVFNWAEAPMDMIDGSIVSLQMLVDGAMGDTWLKSLLVDGILAGVGAVVIFLPQIIILFAFILFMEGSGYLARAAFLMDRIMATVGLNGRAFIPLLSSFACAIPGIMAARTIEHPRDRLTTILIAPLMTCSARLPVYTLVIGAFIPNTDMGYGLGMQGMVMFGLYLAGILSALLVAGILKITLTSGTSQYLIMELPRYRWPEWHNMVIGLYERVKIFMRRAGTMILFSMIALWVFASYPKPPVGATENDIYYSVVGWLGRLLEPILQPIGFNLEIAIALIPGMAAREVSVAALGTVYSLAGDDDAIAASLVDMLQDLWTLPTALAFLAWFVFAPQCISTIAVAKRETNSWRWPAFMVTYLFIMAWVASYLTYNISGAIIG